VARLREYCFFLLSEADQRNPLTGYLPEPNSDAAASGDAQRHPEEWLLRPNDENRGPLAFFPQMRLYVPLVLHMCKGVRY